MKLAKPLERYLQEEKIEAASGNGLVRIWGTQPDAIDEAEDRDRWMELLTRLGIRYEGGGCSHVVLSCAWLITGDRLLVLDYWCLIIGV